MKSFRKVTGLILTLCMLMSMTALGSVPASADTTYETYAQDTVGGSAILHCFDWSYNNIRTALPDIAAAGYTAVQTSPVQRPKDYNSSWTDGVNQWWKMYQPLGLSIAANGTSWLGTKSNLTDLCEEADKYGIKVIVDIVANHLANNGTSGGGYSNLNTGVESDLKNANYYHSSNTGTNDNSRYNITQYHLGMPDLNTGNSYIQQKTLALLEECIDCGVDGFRFDAAKHIELPTDASNIRSNFWPTVLNGATDYASEKGVDEPFYYGEILGAAGPNFAISNYTDYMAVTDNQTGDRALDKAYWTAASELAEGTYLKGASADKSVLWVESHDTYMGNSGSAYFGNTKDVTSDVLNKAWAIVGARAESTSLFFARPNSTMGAASSDTNWKSKAVAEVNKFKNHFDGTGEYLASSGNTAYIERGNKGVVISKLDGGGTVNLTAHQMASGTYTDQVTNNTFTVADGKISGTVGSTGVAVVYNAEESAIPYIGNDTLYLKPNSNWRADNARFAMYLYSSKTGDDTWVDMTSAGSGYYSASVPEGNWTNVIFCRMNPSTTANNWDNKWNQTDNLYPDDGTDCYTVASGTWDNGGGTWSVYGNEETTAAPTTEAPTTAAPTTAPPTTQPTTAQPTTAPTTSSGDNTYTIYAVNKPNWSKVNIYYWGGSSGSISWPGKAMTSYSGSSVYTYEIPKDVTGIIFNNGSAQTVDITSGIKDGAVWTINNTTSGGKYTVSQLTYYLVGSMNGWSNNDNYAFSRIESESGKLEYKLSDVELSAGTELKVHDSDDHWYPSGNNYTVSTTGTYDIYFRPNGDGNSDWYNGYFYLVNVTPYTITWKDGDGNTLKTDSVKYGNTPVYSGETPTKSPTERYTYAFNDTWSPAVTAVTGDATYTAQFTQNDRTFTVTWKNYDGSVLETDEDVVYGSKPSYDGATPTREKEGATTYAFAGWSPQITDETTITADTTYTARFNTNTKTYTITWKDGDGNTLRTETCIEGVTPHYMGATPTKTADAQYTYTFNNTWSPALVAADRDTVYTAQFDTTVNKYTVVFKNYDGTELQNSQVAYGTIPTYTGEAPTKPQTLHHKYTFSGWSPELSAVTGEATYTAQFTDDTPDTYTVTVTNAIGWDRVNMYYWSGSEDNTWPGTVMTADEDNFIYTARIPRLAQGIVFTDGNATDTKQTADITSGIKDGAHWVICKRNNEITLKTVPNYYLVGTMTNWSSENAPTFAPSKNSDGIEEYKLTATLSKNAQVKVYGSDDKWYPNGENYTINADGKYTFYFRPNYDGNSDWHESAFYVQNVTPYTITWKDGDGNTLKTDTVVHGDTPSYTGATPAKTADAQYTYSFNNQWSPSISPAAADITYTAQFSRSVNKYTVDFKNEDGSVLQSSQVAYGDTPSYSGETPSKADDDTYTYTFAGWTPEVVSVTDNAVYTATYTRAPKPAYTGHSLTLSGDIAINFFVDLTDEQAENNTMNFSWTVEGNEKTATSALVKDTKTGYYKAVCAIAVAEMTYGVTASVNVGGKVYSDNYSAVNYAKQVLSSEYRTYFLKNSTEEKYNKLASLVKTMLNLGAKAQAQFERDINNPADKDIDYTPEEVTADTIGDTGASDMYSGVEKYGLEYRGTTILYLSETSLRHYYKIVDQDKFDAVKDSVTFGSDTPVDYSVRGDEIYYELKNISASKLDTLFSLKIGTDDYKYSVLDYVKMCLNSTSADEKMKELAKATYLYNQAANNYFGR